ncbi:hypothetical protein, partial [Marinospirillum sp.]|uniref:hypothetical protein n=1 Tax=Marinospirillum sp. TaxID=2183934 RepID=UPI0025C5EDEA
RRTKHFVSRHAQKVTAAYRLFFIQLTDFSGKSLLIHRRGRDVNAQAQLCPLCLRVIFLAALTVHCFYWIFLVSAGCK